MELGSEYNLSLTELSVNENNVFKYLSSFPYTCFLDSGRSAIKQFSVHLKPDEEILLPEFICESVINCFDKGAIKFYKLQDDFTINICSIKALIGKRTRAIFLMHYFGGMQPYDQLAQLSKLAKENNLLIIEDTTHCVFTNAATIGDYQVSSLRKWIPIPSGGVLYSRFDPIRIFNRIDLSKDTNNRRSYGMILKDLFLKTGLDCNDTYRKIFKECEEKLASQESRFLMSDFATFITSCNDVIRLKKTRIENYNLLESALKQIGIKPVVALEEGDCPLVFPIMHPERDKFRAYLIEKKVYCAVHWPFDGFREEQRLFAVECARNLISLPIDQRYGVKEMNYLIDVISKYGDSFLC